MSLKRKRVPGLWVKFGPARVSGGLVLEAQAPGCPGKRPMILERMHGIAISGKADFTALLQLDESLNTERVIRGLMRIVSGCDIVPGSVSVNYAQKKGHTLRFEVRERGL